jgi:WD40 repeat protein
VAVGNPDGTITVRDTSSGKIKVILRGVQQPHTPYPMYFPAKRLVFSPDNQALLSISTNLTLQVWSMENGDLLYHYGNVYEGTFSPDGDHIASINSLSEVQIRNAADSALEKVIPILSLGPFIEDPTQMVYSPDGKYLAASLIDGTFYVWSLDDDSVVLLHKGNGIPINTIIFSPDGTTLFIETQEGEIQSWDYVNKNMLVSRDGGLGGKGIAFSLDSSLVASAYDKRLFLWDISSSSLVRSAKVMSQMINDIELSPRGDVIAVAAWSGGSILYSFPDLDLMQSLVGSKSLAFSPDASLLSTCGQGYHIWTLNNGEYEGTHLSNYPEPECEVTTFSPDGKTIVSGSYDGYLHFFNIPELKYYKIQAVGDMVTSLAYSPDGAGLCIAYYRNNTIRLIKPTNAVLITAFIGHTQWVTGFSFSPDGTLLASSSDDNTIRLWRVADGQLLRTINTLLPALMNSISFSPDGALLTVGFTDGSIRSWALPNP